MIYVFTRIYKHCTKNGILLKMFNKEHNVCIFQNFTGTKVIFSKYTCNYITVFKNDVVKNHCKLPIICRYFTINLLICPQKIA